MFVACPKCRSVATIPMAYGKPGFEMQQAAKYGLLKLAGCVWDYNSYDRHCKSCSHEWHSGESSHPVQNHYLEVHKIVTNLESDTSRVFRDIEQHYVEAGRSGRIKNIDSVNQTLFTQNEAVSMAFLYALQDLSRLGPEIFLQHPTTGSTRKYNFSDAIFTVQKFLGSINYKLHELAIASFGLGSVARTGTVDDIKKASIVVGEARQGLKFHFEEIRRLALPEETDCLGFVK